MIAVAFHIQTVFESQTCDDVDVWCGDVDEWCDYRDMVTTSVLRRLMCGVETQMYGV